MNAPRNRLIAGDARTELPRLPAGSIDMVLTSPPYFRLRDYGNPAQLGLEATVDSWVHQLRTVLAEARRILVTTGTLWLNVSDSFATDPVEGAERKSLLLAPERLAAALVRDGWVLRNKVVWQKANPMPTSVADRLACTWEALYVFATARRYFFDLDAIRVPHTSQPGSRSRRVAAPTGRAAWLGPNAGDSHGLAGLKARGMVGHPLGKNPGDVWSIASSNYRGDHHATFPVALAERAIRAGCPERRCSRCRAPWRRRVIRALDGTATRSPLGPTCDCDAASEPGLVLDPFMGAGTTGLAAERLGRDWLGVELNPAYVEQADARIAAARGSPAAA